MITIFTTKFITKRLIAFIIFLISGIILIYFGTLYGVVTYINLGIGAFFIGIVIYSLIPDRVVDKNIYMTTVENYHSILENILSINNIKGNVVYIPPYYNLKKGGIYITKTENIESIVNFIPMVSDGLLHYRHGILITPPPGYEFIENCGVDNLCNTYPIQSTSIMEQILKSNNLLNEVEINENENNEITLEINRQVNKSDYGIIPINVDSSIILAVAISLNKVIYIKDSEKYTNKIIYKLKILMDIEDIIW